MLDVSWDRASLPSRTAVPPVRLTEQLPVLEVRVKDSDGKVRAAYQALQICSATSPAVCLWCQTLHLLYRGTENIPFDLANMHWLEGFAYTTWCVLATVTCLHAGRRLRSNSSEHVSCSKEGAKCK